jgi:hypothetical protein
MPKVFQTPPRVRKNVPHDWLLKVVFKSILVHASEVCDEESRARETLEHGVSQRERAPLTETVEISSVPKRRFCLLLEIEGCAKEINA